MKCPDIRIIITWPPGAILDIGENGWLVPAGEKVAWTEYIP